MRTLGYFLVGSLVVASAACSKTEAPVEEAPAAAEAAPAVEEKKAEAAPAAAEETEPAEAEAVAADADADDDADDEDAPTAAKAEVVPAAGVDTAVKGKIEKLNIDPAKLKGALEAAKKANAAKAVTEEAK